MPESLMEQFDKAIENPNVCIANAYFAIVQGDDCGLEIDWMCRKDLADNGTCWCGRLAAHIAGRGDDASS